MKVFYISTIYKDTKNIEDRIFKSKKKYFKIDYSNGRGLTFPVFLQENMVFLIMKIFRNMEVKMIIPAKYQMQLDYIIMLRLKYSQKNSRQVSTQWLLI